MLPVTFEQKNFEFVKPGDMTDEQCSSLPVHRGVDSSGTPVIISCWKFSKEDLEDIAQTGHIWLGVCGSGMPPVFLQTENPFVQNAEK